MDTSVEIVETEDIAVAVLEHRGDHDRLGDSIDRFIAWRRRTGLPPSSHATYTILYDDPHDTPADDYRIDLCVATDSPIAPNEDGIVARVIPGGRCAKLRHVGDDDSFARALSYLCVTWLLGSGERWRTDMPLYCQRVAFFPDVPQHEAITDIYLPLKNLTRA